jgi:inositol oxygenase
MFRWVKKFSPFDLYSKSSERPDVKELQPYCQGLIDEFLPPVLNW